MISYNYYKDNICNVMCAAVISALNMNTKIID